MSDLVIMKSMIGKYEKYYKGHQGRDIDCMITKNDSLKQLMNNLHGNIEDKNKEIIKLKSIMDDQKKKKIKKDSEINQVEATLNSSKDKVINAQRRMELAIK